MITFRCLISTIKSGQSHILTLRRQIWTRNLVLSSLEFPGYSDPLLNLNTLVHPHPHRELFVILYLGHYTERKHTPLCINCMVVGVSAFLKTVRQLYLCEEMLTTTAVAFDNKCNKLGQSSAWKTHLICTIEKSNSNVVWSIFLLNLYPN